MTLIDQANNRGEVYLAAFPFKVICLLILVGLLVGCSGGAAKEKEAMAATSRAIPVAVSPAALKDMPVYLTGLGSVTASNTVSVKSRVDGQLAQVNFKEGQHVNKGELLAVIDPRPFQVQLDQLRRSFVRDQAQLKDAQLNYERFKSLLDDSGAMSQQQVDTQKALGRPAGRNRPRRPGAIDNAKTEITSTPTSRLRSAAASDCGWSMWATWCTRPIRIDCWSSPSCSRLR